MNKGFKNISTATVIAGMMFSVLPTTQVYAADTFEYNVSGVNVDVILKNGSATDDSRDVDVEETKKKLQKEGLYDPAKIYFNKKGVNLDTMKDDNSDIVVVTHKGKEIGSWIVFRKADEKGSIAQSDNPEITLKAGKKLPDDVVLDFDNAIKNQWTPPVTESNFKKDKTNPVMSE